MSHELEKVNSAEPPENGLSSEKERSLMDWWEVVLQNTSLAPINPEMVIQSASRAISTETPLPILIIMCPNWTVVDGERTIQEITPEMKKPFLFLGQELPAFARLTNRCSLRLDILVILSDIISDDWVVKTDSVRKAANQNFRTIRNISWLAAKNLDRTKIRGKVFLQSHLASKVPEFQELFKQLQIDTLRVPSRMSALKLKFLNSFEATGEYSDRRNSLSGLGRVWNRAGFLAALYTLDGLLMERYFEIAFGKEDQAITPVVINTVLSPHAQLLACGWNWRREKKVGIITPTRNGILHSWSEEPNQPFTFTLGGRQ